MRRRLELATAREPAPPTDWARPADVDLDCTCDLCARLKTFLADGALAVVKIRASEDLREHLSRKIDRRRCDVKHDLERRGSPYSLVLTKTTGSFDRALERYLADCRLPDELPTVT